MAGVGFIGQKSNKMLNFVLNSYAKLIVGSRRLFKGGRASDKGIQGGWSVRVKTRKECKCHSWPAPYHVRQDFELDMKGPAKRSKYNWRY